MQYLVDENISKSDKFLKEHPNYKNVKYQIGQAVEDQEILKFVQDDKDNDYVLYTQDKEFALDALIAGLKICYREQNTGKEYKRKAQEIDFE